MEFVIRPSRYGREYMYRANNSFVVPNSCMSDNVILCRRHHEIWGLVGGINESSIIPS